MQGFRIDLLVALLCGVVYLDFEDLFSKSEMLSRSQISFDCSGNCSTFSCRISWPLYLEEPRDGISREFSIEFLARSRIFSQLLACPREHFSHFSHFSHHRTNSRAFILAFLANLLAFSRIFSHRRAPSRIFTQFLKISRIFSHTCVVLPASIVPWKILSFFDFGDSYI